MTWTTFDMGELPITIEAISIAPRPVLVIAPVMDKDAHIEDIQQCVEQVRKIYALYGASEIALIN